MQRVATYFLFYYMYSICILIKGVGGKPHQSPQAFKRSIFFTINMISIFTDGATEGMNGKLGTVSHVGIGIWIPIMNIGISRRMKGISNNEAEYMAIIEAMDFCIHNDIREVQFFLDSMIVVNGVKKPQNKTKNERMNNFKDEIAKKLHNFDKLFIEWIPREKNKMADIFSKKSLLS